MKPNRGVLVNDRSGATSREAVEAAIGIVKDDKTSTWTNLAKGLSGRIKRWRELFPPGESTKKKPCK